MQVLKKHGILLWMAAMFLIMGIKAGEEQTFPPVQEAAKPAVSQAIPSEEPELKKVALTFADGPHSIYTPRLLDGLRERGVQATFFVVGEQAEKAPELLRRMQKEGHLIGNHTYTHLQLKKENWEQYREELVKTNEVIKRISGQDAVYVRPPYGSWDPAFEQELNMFPVLWTVDSRDWCCKDSAAVERRVLSELEAGDVILMHDAYDSSVKAALQLVDRLQKEGYIFVTADAILFD